ncbi:DUF2336 domain-containing protein [Rhodoplanes sp. TEM]|uniref:DUF2336 domain-containing protein n=1 Tax=Rhodoplanes tepidamans TaxID=200616 RepID=A0ABT5JFQ8_RHOTP|nr:MULTISPECIES: DUF2336 domain-containing protein [Rhodoplanes]MDC7788166.1 DUF2336 domain-containing protein [Rhodoplanes tepidamans]MDC7986525.1 DUF2336 domain-containing protein [Rhodoplanes sp. TEM]MDQ0355144.1 uncharacterized protein (DUF2336 family) [Rhodoplanes tepidamans]
MIVRQFLQWVRTAPAGERAEATSALARAYLYSDLPDDERAAIEGVLVMLADDVSPLVRAALAGALAPSAEAPATVVHMLAHDRPDIAAVVLARSPLFIDAELVDLVATGGDTVQAAIAGRMPLPRPVAAAIAEVATAEACLVLVENPQAAIARLSFDRMIERFGHLGAMREALLARPDLPVESRQALIARLSATLAAFVSGRAWMNDRHAETAAREACEKATVALAAEVGEEAAGPLVRHLRVTGQLTAGLVLRALLSGNIALFEEALAELAGLPLRRVRLLMYDRTGVGFRAVFSRAGLPASTFPAFRFALEAWREGPDLDGSARLHRRMVERVLTACGQSDVGEVEPLLALLRRFAAEAAREEALIACEKLEQEVVAELMRIRMAA